MSYASSTQTGAGFTAAQERRTAQSEAFAALWSAAIGAPARLLAALIKRRAVNRTVDTLESLSDRTLADIGISRSDIARIARHGRDAVDRQ